MATEVNGKAVKVHTIYKTKDGIRVPGITEDYYGEEIQ